MNGIEKITARIEQDAGAEIAGILKEAEEKAAAIRGQYEAQAKAEAADPGPGTDGDGRGGGRGGDGEQEADPCRQAGEH